METTTTQTFPFQAEIKELFHLMVNCLYTNKDIFLRELISNASDALDRLRFEALTRPEIMAGSPVLEIRIGADPIARTLTISDSGIGMSREELIANIGTIARSGTRELREKIKAAGPSTDINALIGQFGVGFYSSFMVADRVVLLTRCAGEEMATAWESDGDGTFTVLDASKETRGTSVTLHLKQPDSEVGLDDYTDDWRLTNIIKKYSDFIGYPIISKRPRDDSFEPSAGKDSKSGKVVIEDRVLNSMKPVWKKSPSVVTSAEYAEFYKHIAHDWSEPLKTIHFRAEGTIEFEALLYIPDKAPYDLYYVAPDVGLRLFARGVVIAEKCQDLLPRYLRFVKGVVDAGDMPLNISRQRLQQDRHLTLIQRQLTRKVLQALEDLFNNEYERYLRVWREFGAALKEAIGSDFDNRGRILNLFLFQSSNDSEELTTLKDYFARMKPDQEVIFYLTGASRNMIENSPHLESIQDQGYEVLYMTDAVDELVLQYVPDYEGKKLKSAGKGEILFSGGESKNDLQEKKAEYEGLIAFLQTELDEHVKQVRLSTRLRGSPVCLVVEDHDYSPVLERALQKGKGGGLKQRRVLELNGDHALVSRLRDRLAADSRDPVVKQAAALLHGLALLAEGSEVPDPMEFYRFSCEMLTRVV
jgi:molecular chaperone HtpG